MTIQDGRLDGILPHAFDPQIGRAIAAAQQQGESPTVALVGFRNEDGRIYRVAAVRGFRQQDALRRQLGRLGFQADTRRGTPPGFWRVYGSWTVIIALEMRRDQQAQRQADAAVVDAGAT